MLSVLDQWLVLKFTKIFRIFIFLGSSKPVWTRLVKEQISSNNSSIYAGILIKLCVHSKNIIFFFPGFDNFLNAFNQTKIS